MRKTLGVGALATEFDLIRRHFTRAVSHTVLGVGDDGAVIRLRPGMDLVVSTDMLVAGTHFLPDTDAEALGWKTLAVNLSDLAAMGAEPRWVVLAAALPRADEDWIAAFCRGFFSLAARFGVDVVGGDTTRGPLNLTPTVFGEVPAGQALTRASAKVGDTIWISGATGLAALGLAHLQGRIVLAEPGLSQCLAALQRPQPRVALGGALRGVAHAAIDVSDGLLADLGHVLEQSAVAADTGLGRTACRGDRGRAEHRSGNGARMRAERWRRLRAIVHGRGTAGGGDSRAGTTLRCSPVAHRPHRRRAGRPDQLSR